MSMGGDFLKRGNSYLSLYLALRRMHDMRALYANPESSVTRRDFVSCQALLLCVVEVADNPSNFRIICNPSRSVSGCSVLTVGVRSTSEFVVKICSEISAKAFNSSSVVVAFFPLRERGGMLGLTN
jgi:hypothetical protein